MVPLAESGPTVWTSPLTQGQAEENSQRKEEYGTHDSQTGEIILQHADPEENNTRVRSFITGAPRRSYVTLEQHSLNV